MELSKVCASTVIVIFATFATKVDTNSAQCVAWLHRPVLHWSLVNHVQMVPLSRAIFWNENQLVILPIKAVTARNAITIRISADVAITKVGFFSTSYVPLIHSHFFDGIHPSRCDVWSFCSSTLDL